MPHDRDNFEVFINMCYNSLQKNKSFFRHCGMLLFLVIIFSSILIGGCKKKSSIEKGGGKYYRQGIEAYQKGQYKNAASFFKKSIVFNPDNAYPYLAAGEIYEDYLNDKSKAQDYYLKFISLTRDPQLREMALEWLDQSLPSVEGDTFTIDSETLLKRRLTDLERENSKLRQRATISEIEKVELHAELNGQIRKTERVRVVRALLMIVPAFLLMITAALLMFLFSRRQSQEKKISGAPPENSNYDIFGKYHWMEDSAKTGTIVFSSKAHGEIEVTAYKDNGEEKTSGSGKMDRDTLDVQLVNDEGYEASTRFQFHNRGLTFTAAWRDNYGAGSATGIKEKPAPIVPLES